MFQGPCHPLSRREGRFASSKASTSSNLRDAGRSGRGRRSLYDAAGADELTFLDITASHENRETIFDVRPAHGGGLPSCRSPSAGGVRTVDDIRKLLTSGADKVVDQHGPRSPGRAFVKEAGGRNSATNASWVAIDAKEGVRRPMRRIAGRFSPMAAAIPPGSTPSTMRAKWSGSAPGEILLTSMDRDGTRRGLRHSAHARDCRCGAGCR